MLFYCNKEGKMCIRDSALIEELNGKQAKVKSIVKNITKKRAPLLFNLAELPSDTR